METSPKYRSIQLNMVVRVEVGGEARARPKFTKLFGFVHSFLNLLQIFSHDGRAGLLMAWCGAWPWSRSPLTPRNKMR